MLLTKLSSQEIAVCRTALYDKINGIEPEVSAQLVRYTAQELEPVVKQLGGQIPELLPGYRVKILDGNCLATTEHRLKVLRSIRGGALPGKSLVVLDPSLMLAMNVFPCEDGYAGERALLDLVLATVAANEVWIADRNMCTRGFLFGIAHKQAYFVIVNAMFLQPDFLPKAKAPSPTSNLATGKDWASSAEVKAFPPIDSCCQP